MVVPKLRNQAPMQAVLKLMTDKVPKNGYYDGRYIYDFFRIVMIFSGLAFSKESTPQSGNSEGLSLT